MRRIAAVIGVLMILLGVKMLNKQKCELPQMPKTVITQAENRAPD